MSAVMIDGTFENKTSSFFFGMPIDNYSFPSRFGSLRQVFGASTGLLMAVHVHLHKCVGLFLCMPNECDQPNFAGAVCPASGRYNTDP